MAHDFSINKDVFAMYLAKGEKLLFIDDEIIIFLKKESENSKQKYSDGDVFAKVVLIKDDKGIHLIAAWDHFNYYHPVIVQLYSMLNNNCDVNICGGGYIKLFGNGKCEIRGVSTSFGTMNVLLLKEAIEKLSLPVSLEKPYNFEVATERVFIQNSYEEILYLARNI